MKIGIGTTSELKIRALENALSKCGGEIEILSVKTDSGVPNQPFGFDEMMEGARNRAHGIISVMHPDIAIAVESGLVEVGGKHFDIACVIVVTEDGEEFVSYSAGYFVPDWIIKEIKEKNTEFGYITQRLSGDTDKDPIKYFSDNVVKREELLSQAILIALTQLFNKNKYIQQ